MAVNNKILTAYMLKPPFMEPAALSQSLDPTVSLTTQLWLFGAYLAQHAKAK